MTFEQILQFTITHNATIIEVLIIAILLMVLFLALRAFLFMPEGPEEGATSSMVELEATLKKIIEQAGKVPLTVVPENQAAASTASDLGSGAQAAQLSEEINQLRRELEVKQKEIEQVKVAAQATGASATAPAGLSDEDKEKLEAQIKDLQAKLQEYEIISEDIADLSFYKEQNAKLQKELAAVKGGAPSDAAATAEPASSAPVAEAPATEVKEEPAIVGKSQNKAETTEAVAPAATEEEAPVENVVDDQLMAEFAAAVQKQQTTPTSLKTDAPAAKTAAAGASSTPGDSVLGEVDIEKMVQEAGQISADGPEVSAEQALGTSVDEAKLLEEAKALQGINTEEKKLMNDFESFVKKNEG
jgi:hypothetical protein